MNPLNPVIRSDWDHFFTIVHSDEDWILPLLLAVDGVAAEEAFWTPSPDVASIAAITAHVSGWLEATLRNVLGMPEVDNIDWPELPAPTPENWIAMRDRLNLTVADLGRALHNWSLEELYGVPAGRNSRRSITLTNILVHNAYHAGQIVKLRQAFATRREAAIA